MDDETVRCPTIQSSIESFSRLYHGELGTIISLDTVTTWDRVDVGGDTCEWVENDTDEYNDGHSETTLC